MRTPVLVQVAAHVEGFAHGVSFCVRIPPLLQKPPGSEPQLWELCPEAPHMAVLLRKAPQNAACCTLLLTSAVQPAGTSVPVPLKEAGGVTGDEKIRHLCELGEREEAFFT